MTSTRSGSDYLEQRSALAKRLRASHVETDVLVVEDKKSDLDLIVSSLRLFMGPEAPLRTATNLRTAIAAVKERSPQIVFLDDLLQNDRAETTIPGLRTAGCTGPIIVISGLVTRTRLVELCRLGAKDVIHKDDLNSTRLKEALLKCAPSQTN